MSLYRDASCDACRGLTSGDCGRHGPATLGGVALAEAVAHRHVWVYDGELRDGTLIYHCDGHARPLAVDVRAEYWPTSEARGDTP